MVKGANIISFGKEVKEALDAHIASMPMGIDVTQIADQPAVVDRAVFEFLRSFAEALVIVLGVSFLSLGWRTGIVVATSVPLVLPSLTLAMGGTAVAPHPPTPRALRI